MAAAMKSPSPIAIPIKLYTIQIPLRILQLSIYSLANNPSLWVCLSLLPSSTDDLQFCSFTGISEKKKLGDESVCHFAKNILKIEHILSQIPCFLKEKNAPKKVEKNLKVHQKSPQIKCQNKHETKRGCLREEREREREREKVTQCCRLCARSEIRTFVGFQTISVTLPLGH